MNTWIINGKVYDSLSRSFSTKAIQFQGDTITAISEEAPPEADVLIDAQQGFVLPGFIDIHAHLREPGGDDKETILTGTQAAAKGGYTTILAMPNTHPPIDHTAIWSTVSHSIAQNAVIHVIQSACITKGQQGKELSELFLNSRQAYYTDDGKGLENSKLFLDAVRHAKNHQLLLILHEEDSHLSGNGVVNEGWLSTNSNLPGIPYASEASLIARDLIIANSQDYAVHFTHLSALQSLFFLAKAQELQWRFTCDTTPHHVFFEETDIDISNTSFKVNPPIRTHHDRIALIQGLKKGLISCIGTDHAPHTEIEKSRGFLLAPFGISGFETAFPALYTALVLPGHLSLEELVPLLTSKPSQILKLKDKGMLIPGKKADITIIQMKEKVFAFSDLVSKGKNSPFIGYPLTGWPIKTICEGRLVYEATH